MEKENIILTGFMGTGKTTAGRLLSKKLGYTFVDTDQFIEDRANMSIPDIFKNKGEAAFRAWEHKVAIELGQKNSLVIATGGGFMLNPDNVKTLEKTGRVFCLVASPVEILSRVLRDPGADRPLLQVENPEERIRELLSQRREGYEQFPQIITSEKTPIQVVGELLKRI